MSNEKLISNNLVSNKVTVIVPCYNQASFLSETLDSVLSQSYEDWECIIVNDGSTDTTLDIAEAYVLRDTRFKCISQKNQGVCVARNLALTNACGEYILFLDGDDLISTNFLEFSVSFLRDDLKIKVISPKIRLFGLYNKDYILPKFKIELLLARNIFIMTSLCRHIDVLKTGGFDQKFNKGLEDWDFWISLLSEGGKVYYMDSILFNYRIRTASRNRSFSELDSFLLREEIWNKHKKLYSSYYMPVHETFEYQSISNSFEFKLGSLLSKYIRPAFNFLKK